MRKFTMDVAFLQRMNAGIPGDISRKEGAIVEVANYDATNPPAAFGQPVVLDGTSHNIRHLLSTDAATAIYGMLVRPFPTSNVNTTDGLGTSTPNTANPADVAKKCYMTVLLQNTTAAVKGAQVYARAAATSGALVQGGLEAGGVATVTSPAIVGTGTGTIAASISDATQIVSGTYLLTLQTTSQTSKVTVIDPNGKRLADATVGTAYSDEGLTFTITAAGTMTAGDAFSPVVTMTNLPVPNATFMGPADASGNVEIAYKM
jgi:hypothetical protein